MSLTKILRFKIPIDIGFLHRMSIFRSINVIFSDSGVLKTKMQNERNVE